ncbi:hypothetical protein AVEN_274946-1 [Araneus ventricosus]|uniref:Uncharacterized protein n=1 Tax=Araneus ventricosus TaxID=182803 RepID=A0A4Y2QIQ7_ARAVE|nr:hypothetical protein AVEN_274946-1 [Araneus ventricosus]
MPLEGRRELSMRKQLPSVCFLLLAGQQITPHVLAVRGDPLDVWYISVPVSIVSIPVTWLVCVRESSREVLLELGVKGGHCPRGDSQRIGSGGTMVARRGWKYQEPVAAILVRLHGRRPRPEYLPLSYGQKKSGPSVGNESIHRLSEIFFQLFCNRKISTKK